jgi:hypothetical protein
MNILKAMTSDKPFKRDDSPQELWMVIDEHQKLRWLNSPIECDYELMLRASEVLANNWEIKE